MDTNMQHMAPTIQSNITNSSKNALALTQQITRLNNLVSQQTKMIAAPLLPSISGTWENCIAYLHLMFFRNIPTTVLKKP